MRPRLVIVDYPQSGTWEPLREDFDLAGPFPRAVDALAYLSNNPCPLALVEILLPEVSGYELVRSFGQLAHKPHTVMMSFSNVPSISYRAFEAGAMDFWLRPFPIEWLQKALRKAITSA